MLHRLHSISLALMLALSPAASLASQNQLSSPTTGTVSGLNLTNNYNNAIDSVNTGNSGASAPTNQLSGVPSLGNVWINTTASPDPWQLYDSAQWVKVGYIDTVNHLWNGVVGGGTATIASAATVDPCSTSANYITIGGTTTITSFGSGCEVGQEKTVTFSGALTLTYNATSLIIPGAASISPTVAGDIAKLRYLGAGNWQVEGYLPASGAALINPSIDVGAVEWTFAFNAPSAKYLFGAGQVVSRATYGTLQGVITSIQSATRTNGSPTITGLTDTTQIGAGAGFEMAGFAFPTTVLSCTTTTCTLSTNASSSATSNATFFPYGDGDGSTTFNMPDCRGVALAGRDNMLGTARAKMTTAFALVNPDALGMTLGGQSQTLTMPQLPASPAPVSVSGSITSGGGHPALFPNNTDGGTLAQAGVTAGPFYATGSNHAADTLTSTTNTVNLGSGAAHSIVPPMLTANCLVRALP